MRRDGKVVLLDTLQHEPSSKLVLSALPQPSCEVDAAFEEGTEEAAGASIHDVAHPVPQCSKPTRGLQQVMWR